MIGIAAAGPITLVRITARVIVQTSARSFSTNHYDDDAKNRNSSGT
jgi:hypothetical protein